MKVIRDVLQKNPINKIRLELSSIYFHDVVNKCEIHEKNHIHKSKYDECVCLWIDFNIFFFYFQTTKKLYLKTVLIFWLFFCIFLGRNGITFK